MSDPVGGNPTKHRMTDIPFLHLVDRERSCLAAGLAFERGKLAFDGVNPVAKPGNGMFLPRNRYPMIEPACNFPAGFNPYK